MRDDSASHLSVLSSQSSLGFWRCLLVHAHTVDTTQVQRCWQQILPTSSTVSCSLETRLQTLLSSVIGAQALLSNAEFADGLQYIGAKLGVRLSDSVVSRVREFAREDTTIDCERISPEQHPSTTTAAADPLVSLTQDAISKMRVHELRELLARGGLRTDGLKRALVERLVDARDSALAQHLPKPSAVLDKAVHSATILVLDSQLHDFPWEGLDVLRTCSSVTRMPSLELTLRNVCALSSGNKDDRLCPRVCRDSVSFVLNAAGDLTSTQTQLTPILTHGQDALGWRGIVGRVPDEAEMRCVH